jgi:transposase-like protein
MSKITPSAPPSSPITAPNPEVSERPIRRTFSVAEKKRILDELDQAQPGEIGTLLRREGLYSSTITKWRRQREAATTQALMPAKRGPKSAPINPLSPVVERLERENAQLRDRLARAEAVIGLQKKVSELLGLAPLSTLPDGNV